MQPESGSRQIDMALLKEPAPTLAARGLTIAGPVAMPVQFDLPTVRMAPGTQWPALEVEAITAPDLSGPARSFDILWPLLQLPYLPQQDETGATDLELLEHQQQAIAQLLSKPALYIGDDPGTGKSVAVATAISHLVQSSEIKRALLLTASSRMRWWRDVFEQAAPGLPLRRISGARADMAKSWTQPAVVLMCDYQRAADDLSRLRADRHLPEFGLVVMDSLISGLRRVPQGVQAATRLEAMRRWAMSGGMPGSAEDWRALAAFLLPGVPISRNVTSVELQERLGPHLMRRTKQVLAGQLRNRNRRELWLDLDARQREAYQSTFAQERHMLLQLGEAVTRTHLESVLASLNRTTAFAQGSLDGAKVRAVTDMLEEVRAAEDKIILFSQYRHRALEPLRQALHAYGALMLHETAGENERSQILGSFRRDPNRRILLAHLDSRTDGEAIPASHIVHFDVGWNAAQRIRAEQRFFPSLKPPTPLTITELWAADTHDDGLHRLLADKGLLPGDLPQGTQPSELEGRLTIADWLDRVFERQRSDRADKSSGKKEAFVTTGLLPGTAMLRTTLAELSEPELKQAIGTLMDALGFTTVDPIEFESVEGITMAASSPGAAEQVIVQIVQSDSALGVAVGRALIEAVEGDPKYAAAYLISTNDFTPACKKLAQESDGRLALVSGEEFYRHLRILGWF